MIRLPQPLTFQWDEGNRDKNWLKHRVTNSEAEQVFFDPHKRLAKDVAHSNDDEIRYILLGKTRAGRLLFVVFTIRRNQIRVISARDMNRRERPLYDETDVQSPSIHRRRRRA
ncbi:MAG: BrnT family toxin [Chloroflexi bacterium]|nr:BrnT family toxin [Chloroflexota bacterium]